jgi:branched-chain amino acid transport system substrate-binding protein
VVRDNRSLPAVGVDHLRELAAVPDLVAVFGGRFSPVYIESLPVAHELGIPLMNPWGSADPITDHGLRPSFSFRLSLKDAWAAPAFVRFAREHHGATRLGVLLPNTAWGRSNQAAIMRAAAAGGASVVGERWYNWGDASLLDQYQELRLAGAQALILVANEGEGALLVREMAALPESERLPIVSHWGITGGQFARQAGEALQKVDLAVIQTVSFVGNERPAARRVLAALQQRYGIAAADQVTSPAGVAHAYDLTHLLARAIRQAGSTERRRIRTALEQLGPYDGLVRHYQRPFAPDRHDALAETDVIFARYAAGGERLLPVPSAGRP